MLHGESLQNPTESRVLVSILWEHFRGQAGPCVMIPTPYTLGFGISLFSVSSPAIMFDAVASTDSLSLLKWQSSDSQGSTQRMGPLIAAPDQPHWDKQNQGPEKKRRTGLGEEQHDREQALGDGAEAVDGRVAQLHSNRRRR